MKLNIVSSFLSIAMIALTYRSLFARYKVYNKSVILFGNQLSFMILWFHSWYYLFVFKGSKNDKELDKTI